MLDEGNRARHRGAIVTTGQNRTRQLFNNRNISVHRRRGRHYERVGGEG